MIAKKPLHDISGWKWLSATGAICASTTKLARGAVMTYNHNPRNPKTVAEMTDANALRGLACALDLNLADLATAGARAATMHAITILNGAARSLTP